MPRDNRYHVCIWCMFVFMSVVVSMWGSVEIFVVWRPLLKIVFNLAVLKYVVCLYKGYCVFYFVL